MAFNWTCPYCSRPQTVTNENYSNKSLAFDTVKSSHGFLGMRAYAIICSNPDCISATIVASIHEAVYYGGTLSVQPNALMHFSKRLWPESSSRPQPEFIPEPIREDYYEACAIRDLSPKASATLSRRCIQGMIRDFAGISKARLVDEIDELRKRVASGAAPKGVSEESVDAIDHVRGIGNIGAHMEKDINLIVSIEPDEAQILIDLIESLFDEWYVARQKREERFASVKQLADLKKADKQL